MDREIKTDEQIKEEKRIYNKNYKNAYLKTDHGKEMQKKYTEEAKQRRKEDPEPFRKRKKAWEKKNFIKVLVTRCNSTKRLKKYNIADKITFEEMYDLFYNKQNQMCPILKRQIPVEQLSTDHIIPLCKGGSNKIENIQIVYIGYNLFKNNSDEVDARRDWEMVKRINKENMENR